MKLFDIRRAEDALEALRKRPCENYEAPQDCITAGPQVLAAEGCGPCVARASQAPRGALEALADEWAEPASKGGAE